MKLKFEFNFFIVLISLYLLVPTQSAYACTCLKYSHKFINNLNKSDYIAAIEIVGRDTIKDFELDRFFTIAKVIKQFSGPSLGSEVSILEGNQQLECIKNMKYEMGSTLIIKGKLEKRNRFEYNIERHRKKSIYVGHKGLVLVLTDCADNVLKIENGIAIGYITKSSAPNMEEEEYVNEPQQIPFPEVARMIRRKCRPFF